MLFVWITTPVLGVMDLQAWVDLFLFFMVFCSQSYTLFDKIHLRVIQRSHHPETVTVTTVSPHEQQHNNGTMTTVTTVPTYEHEHKNETKNARGEDTYAGALRAPRAGLPLAFLVSFLF